MAEELLAILAAYGMGIGLVHLFQWRNPWGRRETSHAVILTRNVGVTVEWQLQTLALTQWMRAKHTRITIVDEGSTDETIRIVQRMIANRKVNWELVPAGSPAEAERFIACLGKPDEVLRWRDALVGDAGTVI